MPGYRGAALSRKVCPASRRPPAAGGRGPKKKGTVNDIERLHALINEHKAGSPTQPDVYWVCLRPYEIGGLYFGLYGIRLSNKCIKRELHHLGYRYRKIAKNCATGAYGQRNEQFHLISMVTLAMSQKSPVLSIDCKKKERLGTLYREGKSYCIGQKEAYDHDYSYLGQGRVVPHGIFDVQQNKGFISIGDSSETATFIIDNLRWYWLYYGIHQYPDAQNLLLFCDAGGGNSYRHHAFKKARLALASEIGLCIIVVHYPPYASKWNPIEHRLFAHVHAAMSGHMFESYQHVKEIIEKTTTSTGLTVVVRLNLGEYPINIKTDKKELDYTRILHHHTIPELNYRIFPD